MFKKFIVPVLSLGLFLVNPAFAVEHGNDVNDNGNANGNGNAAKMMDYPHAKKADHMKAEKQWMESLNLTDEQKDKIKSIRVTYEETVKEDYKQMKELRQEIMDMSHEKDVDQAKLDDLLKQRNELANKFTKAKVMKKHEIFHVLNPEQQVKYKEMKQKMKEKYEAKKNMRQ